MKETMCFGNGFAPKTTLMKTPFLEEGKKVSLCYIIAFSYSLCHYVNEGAFFGKRVKRCPCAT